MSDRAFASIVAAFLVIIAAASRVVPHPWNFTPMLAVALFAGARIERRWLAAVGVLGCLALGDIILGAFPYPGMIWVYASMLVVVLLGRILRSRTSVVATLVTALGAGFLFFVVTNFAVFAGTNLYPHTLDGLGQCYVAALPFYRNQIVGDLVFTGALFGLHAFALSLRRTSLA